MQKSSVNLQFEKLEATRQQLLHQLAALDDSVLYHRPADHKWSILQIIFHLNDSESSSVKYIAKKSRGGISVPKSNFITSVRSSLLSTALQYLKWKKPAVLPDPPENLNAKEMMKSWDETRVHLRQLLEQLPEDMHGREIFRHPIAGRMNMRHALTFKCVRGVNFQPVQDAGRNEGFDPKLNRIVLSEIRRRIVEDSGIFADGDMIPLPCNPASISIGYGVRNGDKVIPLTSLVPREALLPAMPNAISFEKYPELRRRFVDLLSLSTADTNTTERLGSLLCCLPDVPMPEGSGYENVFRVTIVEFLDRFNFCLGNVKRSCVHFVTPEGSIIPFDTYNTFYRPGAAGNARLAEARR
jgi:hypothetical protein